MNSNLFHKVQSKISSNDIAITFDDGPDPLLTPQVLDLLNEFDAKATFFCIGSNVKKHTDIAKRIVNEGHGIGNHSYEHSTLFPLWSPKRMMASIKETDEILKSVSGADNTLFRPPFGVTNTSVAFAIATLGKRVISWSIRSKDTCNTAEQVISKVKRKLKPGAIILFHDTNPNILTELRTVLEYCKSCNLKSVAIK